MISNKVLGCLILFSALYVLKVEAFIADESATKLPKESLDTSLFFFNVQ